MPALLNILGQELGEGSIRKIADQVGSDEASTQKAITAALPMLIGALSQNANASEAGAKKLDAALERDHDGSLLDNFDALLSRSKEGGSFMDAASTMLGGISVDRRTVDGNNIIEHMLGGKRTAVELGISKASGMDVRNVRQLLSVLAPVVMSALGRVRREQQLNADQVAALLNRERGRLEREMPSERRRSLLDVLDRDDDGDLTDEVARIGSTLSKSGLKEIFG